MAVRAPILTELLAYKKAKGEAEKEAHRQSLRRLFETIGDSAAQAFQAMLRTHNALGVTFREVLKDDSFRKELFGILDKKYAPALAQCTLPAPSSDPQASAGPQGVTLPLVTLTAEGAFDELHKDIRQRIEDIRAGANQLTRFATFSGTLPTGS